MPKVYITHEQSRFDYGPAEAFGSLVTVNDRMYSFAPGNQVNAGVQRGVTQSGAAFNDEEDYVLPSGSAIMTALFFVHLAATGHRRIRVLIWNNNEGAYNVGALDLTPFIAGATNV